MTKIFLQIVVSALVSLGIISGFDADVREQVRQTGGEVKAALHEAMTTTVEAAADIRARAEAGVDAQADADSSFSLSGQQNADADLGAGLSGLGLGSISSWFETSAQADVEADGSVEENGFETWLGFDLSASNQLNLGLDSSD